MTEAFAVLAASLIGSWHCAGMCGPLVGFLAHNQKNSKLILTMYHLGRLLGYGLLTIFFRLIGQSFSLFLKSMGVSYLSQWFFFALILVWAALTLINFKLPFSINLFSKLKPKNKFLFGGLAGVSTAFLPCIWLYGFVITASSTSHLTKSLILISFFWAGTIPALIGAQILLKKLTFQTRKFSKIAATLTLVASMAFSLYAHYPKSNAIGTPTCPLHSHTKSASR